jgi:hypothetical protein
LARMFGLRTTSAIPPSTFVNLYATDRAKPPVALQVTISKVGHVAGGAFPGSLFAHAFEGERPKTRIVEETVLLPRPLHFITSLGLLARPAIPQSPPPVVYSRALGARGDSWRSSSESVFGAYFSDLDREGNPASPIDVPELGAEAKVRALYALT